MVPSLAVTDNMIEAILLQLRILRFGLLQDGDVRVGALGKEILVISQRPR